MTTSCYKLRLGQLDLYSVRLCAQFQIKTSITKEKENGYLGQ